MAKKKVKQDPVAKKPEVKEAEQPVVEPKVQTNNYQEHLVA